MREKVEWSQVMAFVARKDPAVAAGCVGVPRAQIEAVQARLGITLPANYVGFLETMGESSGGMRLFGAGRIHKLSVVLKHLAAPEYPVRRFFKVAFESDPDAPAFEDMYIDLSRAGADDGPLVRFEIPFEAGDEAEEEPLSVTEKILYEIFWQLGVAGAPFAARVLVFDGGPSRNARRAKQEATAALTGRTFELVLPDQPGVACLERGGVSLLISINEELIIFEMGGADRRALEQAIEELSALVPGAVVSRPPRRRGDDDEDEVDDDEVDDEDDDSAGDA